MLKIETFVTLCKCLPGGPGGGFIEAVGSNFSLFPRTCCVVEEDPSPSEMQRGQK